MAIALMLAFGMQARAVAGASDADEVAAVRAQNRPTELAEPRRNTSAEMTAIFEADQAARQDWAHADLKTVMADDAARREATRKLLDTGKLESGEDYYHAAFIFQHGQQPGDYLLAHTLAVIAVARGKPSATWIAAATLDRYLQAIGQKQVYGTQFTFPKGKPVTQAPYDRKLVSDALRVAMRVPPQAEQRQQAAEFEAQRGGD